MEQHGIIPLALRWFKSYLNENYQLLEFASSLSNPAVIKAGVTQGSILGTILFLNFINDSSRYVASCKSSLFADDTTLVSSGADNNKLSVSLKTDISSLFHWANDKKMSLNSKTFSQLSEITVDVMTILLRRLPILYFSWSYIRRAPEMGKATVVCKHITHCLRYTQ